MTIYKEFCTPADTFIKPKPFLSNKEIEDRQTNYPTLEPKKFSFKENKLAFRSMEFEWQGKNYEIQMNHCTNPLCKNFGLPQEQFNIKGKPSRYRMTGNDREKSIQCNPDRRDPDDIQPQKCNLTIMSNWSLSEEIERLIRINSLKAIEPDYEFRKPTCILDSTPLKSPKDFYKRGVSKAKSQIYQCKTCKKYTSVLPTKQRNTTYHQQRNEILPIFAKLLVNKTSINRTCEILGIAKGTYYQKLEWLYRCCLEFLETRETKPLAQQSFDQMWLNTDKLHYVLNNVLKRGQGKNSSRHLDEKQLPTHIIATADAVSNYVFRSDIAYDWDISLERIEEDTQLYKEDHLNGFQRKNDRYAKYSHSPMLPTKNDTQTFNEYREQAKNFDTRRFYVDGLHVHSGYTAKAHLWLIKNQLNVQKWRFITDNDGSLLNSYQRVFRDEILSKDAHQMVCTTDKTLTRSQAKRTFFYSVRTLKAWGALRGYEKSSLRQIALFYIEDELKHGHRFHNQKTSGNGEIYYTHANNPLKHPIPTSDRGQREIDILTDVSHLTDFQQASLILNTNDNAINGFLQIIRRRLSVLERPLVTARGDGKSYIYANFYPKYSQMAITILRTYYNFCRPYKSQGVKKTPAERLGIADRVYTWEDIIYKR